MSSISAYAAFISGCDSIARTSANATRWVKDTFVPWRATWCWLMTRRFSSRNLTAMVRAEVAVGRSSDASMFDAMRALAPASGRGAGASLAGRSEAVVAA